MNILFLKTSGLAALVGAAHLGTAQTRYTLQEVPNFVYYSVVNDSGLVAGFNGGQSFAWEPKTDTVTLIPGLPGNPDNNNVVAMGMNNSGQVFGDDYSGFPRTFVWSKDQGTRQLADFGFDEQGSRNTSNVYACNDLGDAVGRYKGSASGTPGRAFYYKAGEGWHQLSGIDPNARGREAWAVNDAGQAAGFEFNRVSQGGNKGLFWRSDGSVLDMGHPWGAIQTDINRMNDDGWVTGDVLTPSQQIGFVWREAEGYTQIANPINPGFWTHGLGINNPGTVVGVMGDGQPRNRTGFIWDRVNGTRELNPLLDPAFSGYDIESASTVNESGQITANAVYNGTRFVSVLLTPVPEPGMFVVLGVGLLAVLRRRRR